MAYTRINVLTSEVLNQYGISISYDAGASDSEKDGTAMTTLQSLIWLTPIQLLELERAIAQARVTMEEKLIKLAERVERDKLLEGIA